MTNITRSAMTIGAFIDGLKQHGVTVAEKRNNHGALDLMREGKLIGELAVRNSDGVPFIRSFQKTEIVTGTDWDQREGKFVKTRTEIHKHYYSVAGFLRYGV